uniref:NADH dehydrogenase subunit 4 n=1 Tax=Dolophilodes bellatulus TaxID=2682779 RepID=UPI0022DCDA74|nr:NADH dehydrogenase subunit 4 [Dolophilodes bellatulus]UZZ43891.1 NADH dehydrogenase subunit 4 [Dolophilodes bellatulus]
MMSMLGYLVFSGGFMKFNKMWWLNYFNLMIFFIFCLMKPVNLFYFSGLNYSLGMDVLSWGMVLLSIWICSLMIMASYKIYKNKFYYEVFILMNLLLLMMLLLTFLTMNLFMFYLFFESSLLPTLILIIGWGYQSERIQAGVYLIFYTLFASLPMLLGIFYIYKMNYFLIMYMIKDMNYFILYFIMMVSFLVKMPMFFVHLWLPKAHVEAPVSGSMILAGVMLKLGGYGLFRVMKLMVLMSMKLNIIWIIISMIGSLYLSLICLLQIDMKMLVAYSSVVHMAIALGGMLTLSNWGFSGGYVLMLGHGLCSSGLFCLVNLCYERLSSRSLMLNKGLMNFMPTLSLWWFLLVSSNMAAPPSMNLLGEISLMNGIVSWSRVLILFIMLISFFSAGYSLYLYTFSQHGSFINSLFIHSFINSREYILLMMHWFPLNILVLKIEMFYLWL